MRFYWRGGLVRKAASGRESPVASRELVSVGHEQSLNNQRRALKTYRTFKRNTA